MFNRTRRAAEARQTAEVLFDSVVTPQQLRDGVGRLSSELSYIEEGFIEAIEDWSTFHPHIVRELREGMDDDH